MVYNSDRLKTTTATDYTDLVTSAQKKFTLKTPLNIMSVIVVCFFIYFLNISVLVQIQKIMRTCGIQEMAMLANISYLVLIPISDYHLGAYKYYRKQYGIISFQQSSKPFMSRTNQAKPHLICHIKAHLHPATFLATPPST